MSGRTQQDRGYCWYFPVVSKFKEQAMLLYLWVKSLERRILAAATLVFALALLPIQSQCQPSEDTTSSGERSIEFGFESDLVSRYVWHGLEWSTGSVSQNTLWLSAHNITASLWANSDLVARADGPLFNELDLSLAHELSADLAVTALVNTPNGLTYSVMLVSPAMPPPPPPPPVGNCVTNCEEGGLAVASRTLYRHHR